MLQIAQFLSSPAGLIIMGSVICLNALLSAASSALGQLKGIIPDATENKLLSAISSLLSVTQKVVDFLSANRAH